MNQLSTDKDELLQIVSAAQTRTYAEEIELLGKRGNDINWLLNGLDSHEKKGISSQPESVNERVKKYGSNEKYKKPLSSIWQLLKQALDDFILKILIISSLASIAIEVATAKSDQRKTAWIQGFVILVAVSICALVTAINNYSKERQFQELNGVAEERKRVTLRRDGTLMEMHQDKVLVGDIVNVVEGMEVPADAILIQANEITTDQSAMTGETDPIQKHILSYCIQKKQELELSGQKNESQKHEVPSPILLSGTKILTGEGKMMILVVGDVSCIGKIRSLLDQEEQIMTPLQTKLQKLASDIGKFGLYSAIAILLILILRFSIEKGITKEWDTGRDVKELINYFILGLTVIVVAIPEGLPLSVTLSLAVSVKQMLADQNLVRKLEACETMGGANNICSDKTGTLTMNKMTLQQMWNGRILEIDAFQEKIDLSQTTTNQEWIELFKIGTCVNSTANLVPEEKGSSTEIALLKYMKKIGVNYEDYRERYPTLLKYPFSSSRKRMSIIINRNGERYLFVKGASEMVLSCCNKWFDMQANKIDLISESIKEKMEETIVKMAESSLRTLCLGFKKINQSCDIETKDEKGVFEVEKHDLILLNIFGVRDIPRKQVPSAIAKCHKAGITVRMVTGDNIITARAIARDVGIIKQGDNSLVMEGAEFIRLIGGVVCKKCKTQICECAKDLKQAEADKKELRVDTIANGEQFDKLKDRLRVLARSRPEDKYALVTGLKERGEVVAVTGDGTNDAPALKKGDVGFAMGIAGTEVAREAAAIILLDDNFNSIVKAVLWGRNIYDSIRKFIQFQLTVNVVAVVITFFGAALYKQQILVPIQMLWVNLIMDTLASLALATQSPTDELLDRKPTGRNEYIISKRMFKHIIGQAILQLIVLGILIFMGEKFIPEYADSYDAKDGVFASHPEWKWRDGVVGGTIRSGRLIFVDGSFDYQPIEEETHIFSRHFTFIFNTFVMLQIFNFINCRKIQDQLNILAGITRNKLFIVIVAAIFFLQVLLVTFTGQGFHVYDNYGLHPIQWVISMAFGCISIPVNLMLKQVEVKETPLFEEAAEGEEQNKKEQFTGEELNSQNPSILIKVKSNLFTDQKDPIMTGGKLYSTNSEAVGFM